MVIIKEKGGNDFEDPEGGMEGSRGFGRKGPRRRKAIKRIKGIGGMEGSGVREEGIKGKGEGKDNRAKGGGREGRSIEMLKLKAAFQTRIIPRLSFEEQSDER